MVYRKGGRSIVGESAGIGKSSDKWKKHWGTSERNPNDPSGAYTRHYANYENQHGDRRRIQTDRLWRKKRG